MMSVHARGMIGSLFLIALLCGPAPAADPGPYTFQLVADTSTAVPGGVGTFTGFRYSLGASGYQNFVPSIDGNGVAFTGVSAIGSGVYTDIGGLSVVADTMTAIPSGVGNFTGFNDPVIDDGKVVFLGGGGSVDGSNTAASFQEGVYTDLGGLHAVADKTTPVPNATGTFTQFVGPVLDDGHIAFWGKGPTPQFERNPIGIYSDLGGSLAIVADDTTSAPGTGDNFRNFGAPDLSGTTVAFANNLFSAGGVYATLAGVSLVSNTTTPIPGGVGTFDTFDDVGIDGNSIVYVGGAFASGSDPSQTGIYVASSGLAKIADLSTPVPGGGSFVFFGSPSLDHGNIVFWARTTIGQGLFIYTADDQMLWSILREGDTLDGKIVDELTFGSHGFSGNMLTFHVTFTNNTDAIYRTTLGGIAVVPAPAAAPAITGLLALATLRRRRVAWPHPCNNLRPARLMRAGRLSNTLEP